MLVIPLVIILVCGLLTLVWLNRRRFRNIGGRLLCKKCERLVSRETTNDLRYTLKLIRQCRLYVYDYMVYRDISEFRFVSYPSLLGIMSKLQHNINDLRILLGKQAVTSNVNPAGFSQAEIDELRRGLELLEVNGGVDDQDKIRDLLAQMGTDRCPKCGFSYSWNGYQCGHCKYGE